MNSEPREYAGFLKKCMVWFGYICYTYTTGLSALPDIYTCALGPTTLGLCIYQAKHKCLWHKCYVPHCLYRLIARQYKLENWIYYIDSLGKFDYGPAHASSNHCYTYVCQQKLANLMEIVESSYKWLIKQLFRGYCIISQSLLNI